MRRLPVLNFLRRPDLALAISLKYNRLQHICSLFPMHLRNYLHEHFAGEIFHAGAKAMPTLPSILPCSLHDRVVSSMEVFVSFLVNG